MSSSLQNQTYKVRYKEPDRKGPRFRATSWRYNLMNRDLYKRFLEENPSIDISYNDFKFIFKQINVEIIDQSINNREGIILPKGLGRIWIGLFPPLKMPAGADIFSDMTGKICWDFDFVKYSIDNPQFYGFIAHRSFKNRVSSALRYTPERYIRINKIIQAHENRKKRKLEQDESDRLNNKICYQSSEDTEQSSECGFENY